MSIQDRFEPDEEERGEEVQVQAPSSELSEFRGSDGSDTETISRGRVGGDHRDSGASSRAPTNFRAAGGGLIPVMPGLILAELYQCIEDRQTDLQGPRRWEHGASARIDVEDGRRGRTAEGDHMQSHGNMRLAIRAIAHQCGLLGCQVGEASNLGQYRPRP